MPLTLPRPVLPPAFLADLDQLDLRDPRFRPLSSIQTVLRDLGEFKIDAPHVRELVESGFLIGFNIAVSGDGKSEVRLLTKSIDHFRDCRGRKRHDLEWAQIFRLIVPHQKPVLTGLEIRRALICDRGHVENLILAGCLVSLKKSQPGPGGSWTVSRASFEAFMKGRMI